MTSKNLSPKFETRDDDEASHEEKMDFRNLLIVVASDREFIPTKLRIVC